MSDELTIQKQDEISKEFHSLIESAKAIIDANNLLKLEVEKEKEKEKSKSIITDLI